MHESGLAKELWPQLQQIAESSGFVKVTAIDMVIGSLHGVKADFLRHSFVDHAFIDTAFAEAELSITILEPGDTFKAPGQEELITATGFDLMITRIEGDRQ